MIYIFIGTEINIVKEKINEINAEIANIKSEYNVKNSELKEEKLVPIKFHIKFFINILSFNYFYLQFYFIQLSK